jgi:hypothetical protein
MRRVLGAVMAGFLAAAYAAQPIPFRADDYPPESFRVTEQRLQHGVAEIHVIRAQKTTRDKSAPFVCRAWLSVSTPAGSVLQRYFDDFDPVGASYGIYVPAAHPDKRHFALIKLGDYDGRLYLVREDGRTFDLDGGSYFVAGDGRFLFSQHDSDMPNLTVFDLAEDRVVFSTREGLEIMEWYTKDGQVFFTGFVDDKSPPREKLDAITRYDFARHRLVTEPAKQDPRTGARKVDWLFEAPRNNPDCGR